MHLLVFTSLCSYMSQKQLITKAINIKLSINTNT